MGQWKIFIARLLFLNVGSASFRQSVKRQEKNKLDRWLVYCIICIRKHSLLLAHSNISRILFPVNAAFFQWRILTVLYESAVCHRGKKAWNFYHKTHSFFPSLFMARNSWYSPVQFLRYACVTTRVKGGDTVNSLGPNVNFPYTHGFQQSEPPRLLQGY